MYIYIVYMYIHTYIHIEGRTWLALHLKYAHLAMTPRKEKAQMLKSFIVAIYHSYSCFICTLT